MPLSYNEVRKLILQTLEERPEGTKVEVPNQQNYELALLDYVQQLETAMSTSIVGIADATTVPIEPPSARVAYLSQVGVNATVTYKNFVDAQLNPIVVTTDADHIAFVTLFWNTNYWQVQAVMIPVIYSGGGGTNDYNELLNLPSINGVTVKGDLTAEMLKLVSVEFLNEAALRTDVKQSLTTLQQEQATANAGLNLVVVSESDLSAAISEERADVFLKARLLYYEAPDGGGIIMAMRTGMTSVEPTKAFFVSGPIMTAKPDEEGNVMVVAYLFTFNYQTKLLSLSVFNPLVTGSVAYSMLQTLSDEDKVRARTNIAAADVATSVQSQSVRGVEITENAPAAQDDILYIEVKPDADGQ